MGAATIFLKFSLLFPVSSRSEKPATLRNSEDEIRAWVGKGGWARLDKLTKPNASHNPK